MSQSDTVVRRHVMWLGAALATAVPDGDAAIGSPSRDAAREQGRAV